MISITEQKPLEEVTQYLSRCQNVYLIGCGTCTTMQHTGGKTEVLDMKTKLEAAGKKVTGWMIIPTACDPLTKEAMAEQTAEVEAADCLLVMSCAFGVQTVNLYTAKAVYPALNTLFIGKEDSPGHFAEICLQCGQCILGRYAGVCPVTQCAKELLSGPCGGSKEGKCEQTPEHECAWILIYDRMKKLGQLDLLKENAEPKDHSKRRRQRQMQVVATETTKSQ